MSRASPSTRYRLNCRSSSEVCANRSRVRRVATTPSAMIRSLVSDRRRTCTPAVTSAATRGSAMMARPSSASALRDLGRRRFIWRILAEARRHGCGVAAAQLCPGVALQLLFPVERAADDAVQVVQPGLPPQHLADAIALRHQCGRVPRATRQLDDIQRSSTDALDAAQYLADAVAMSVAAIQDLGLPARSEVVHRQQVRTGKVLHVDVVPHAGAVRRRIVGAEDAHLCAFADTGLAGDLHQ